MFNTYISQREPHGRIQDFQIEGAQKIYVQRISRAQLEREVHYTARVQGPLEDI